MVLLLAITLLMGTVQCRPISRSNSNELLQANNEEEPLSEGPRESLIVDSLLTEKLKTIYILNDKDGLNIATEDQNLDILIPAVFAVVSLVGAVGTIAMSKALKGTKKNTAGLENYRPKFDKSTKLYHQPPKIQIPKKDLGMVSDGTLDLKVVESIDDIKFIENPTYVAFKGSEDDFLRLFKNQASIEKKAMKDGYSILEVKISGSVIKDLSKLKLVEGECLYEGKHLSDLGDNSFDENDFRFISSFIENEYKNSSFTLQNIADSIKPVSNGLVIFHGTNRTNYNNFIKGKSPKGLDSFGVKQLDPNNAWDAFGGELGNGHYFSSDRSGPEAYGDLVVKCTLGSSVLSQFTVIALPTLLTSNKLQHKFKKNSVKPEMYNKFLNQFDVVIENSHFKDGILTEYKFNSTPETITKFQNHSRCTR